MLLGIWKDIWRPSLTLLIIGPEMFPETGESLWTICPKCRNSKKGISLKRILCSEERRNTFQSWQNGSFLRANTLLWKIRIYLRWQRSRSSTRCFRVTQTMRTVTKFGWQGWTKTIFRVISHFWRLNRLCYLTSTCCTQGRRLVHAKTWWITTSSSIVWYLDDHNHNNFITNELVTLNIQTDSEFLCLQSTGTSLQPQTQSHFL